MARAFIGLGSNLNDPPARVRAAISALCGLPETRLIKASSLYRTAPVGPQDQPDFCNAVAEIDTRLAPLALLDGLQAIEASQQRRRVRRWGPRTLDLDLLLYDQSVIRAQRLEVPHPRLAERAFVLVPLAEIAPDLRIPRQASVQTLLARLHDQGVNPWRAI